MKNYLTVRNGMDDIFDRMFATPFSLLDESRWTPRVYSTLERDFEIEEADHAYLLSVDLPGIKKEDVKIDVNGRTLTLSGERKDRANASRNFVRFERSFSLPESVDVEKIEANMEDGVLRIALPKVEAAKPRAIEIQTGRSGLFSKLIGSSDEKASH